MPDYPASPLTRVTYTGNGVITNYTIPFPYIAQADVEVTVNGVATAFTFVNETTLQISPAPANGASIEVYRNTELEDPVVDYNNASTLRESDLDLSVAQLLYLIQELIDQLEVVDGEVAGADIKAKVSATDTTSDYLQNKLISSDDSITITRINPGDVEQLDLSAGLRVDAWVRATVMSVAKTYISQLDWRGRILYVTHEAHVDTVAVANTVRWNIASAAPVEHNLVGPTFDTGSGGGAADYKLDATTHAGGDAELYIEHNTGKLYVKIPVFVSEFQVRFLVEASAVKSAPDVTI